MELCTTFEEAARQRGLLESNIIWIQTLIEAALDKFRRYFATLIYNVAPPYPMEIFNKLLNRLWPLVPAHPEIAWRKEKALNQIEYVLRSLNTNSQHIGLESPEHYDHRIIEQTELFEYLPANIGQVNDMDPDGRLNWQSISDKNIAKFNIEQRHVYN